MGVSNSQVLKQHFKEISENEKWIKAETVISAYNSGNYDFGIDYNVVAAITEYSADKSKILVQSHSMNDVGM